MRLDRVNERSTSIVTLTFRDENGAAVTPGAASYRIDDVASGTEILDDTAFTPSSDIHQLTISDTQNRILTAANVREERLVTISITYGTGRKLNQEYRYYVMNLTKIT